MDFYVDEVSIIDRSVAELIVNGGFENGLNNWSAHDTADISLSAESKYTGSSSLYITNRSATGAGAQQYLTGKMAPGRVYRAPPGSNMMPKPHHKLECLIFVSKMAIGKL